MAQELDDPIGPGVPGQVNGVAALATNSLVEDEEEAGLKAGLLPYQVVAIGASAGGLEAYVELLAGLPPNTGAAFVVISHLSATLESHLPEILARHTAMPVALIADGLTPLPNHVYVIPPNTRATIVQGRFVLAPRPENDRAPQPIDRFFKSLARDQRNRALGVILSGSDGDGALGLRAIKGEGGIAIVQSPDSARFPEMPRSGIAADHADLILPPARIGAELGRLLDRFAHPELRPMEDGQAGSTEDQDFVKLFALLRTVSGIDFRNYKRATVQRRLARRMVLQQLQDVGQYLAFLQAHPEELCELQEDLLISVTRFFRDPEVFEGVRKELLPRVLRNRPPDQQIRVWVAGCSTGEEVYSFAISLLEYFSGASVEPPIQIFGTDASERSIQRARAGVYADTIAGDVSPERLRRYFSKDDRGYQITKRVRDLCIFARQNLCTDPPFGRLDLISCRNVLIYLATEEQDTILSTFHYSLKPTGQLILGSSETLREQVHLFRATDRKNKFYARAEAPNNYHFEFPRRPEKGTLAPAPMPVRVLDEKWGDVDLQRAVDRIVLARHSPPGVVVNDKLEVLQVRGHTAPFLEIPAGTPNLQLLRMAREGLASALRNALEAAMEGEIPVTLTDVPVRTEEGSYEISLEVLPVQGVPFRQKRYLVLFLPNAPRTLVEKIAPQAEADVTNTREMARLQQELASSKLYLQALIEERDSRNQELTSAYEEAQSTNEELQSTNEELETAKEELQSINEELQTVNEELRNRNVALSQASNDLSNLIASISLPLVMLGMDLRIRHFTPASERVLRIRQTDVGRPISEIRFSGNLESFERVLREVLDTLGQREVEVQDLDGCWHLLRVRPYRTSENKIDGLVIILVDVDKIRRSEAATREALEFSRAVLEGAQAPLLILNADLTLHKANAAFRALSGLADGDLEGRRASELLSLIWGFDSLQRPFEGLSEGSSVTGFEVEHEAAGPPPRVLRLNARALNRGSGRIILVMLEDVTVRKEAERVLARERDRLAGQVETVAEELGHTREELRLLAAELLTSQEEERRRVARELHDDISQKLALLRMDLEELSSHLPTDGAIIREHLEQLTERTDLLAEDVRLLSHGLHPSVLEHLGLQSALQQLAEEFRDETGMPVSFDAEAVPEQLPTDVRTTLYRISQEALRNIKKHAGETHVRVSLECKEQTLRLTIRDLGEGFDSEKKSGSGLGLISMQERARLVGGVLRIMSAPRAGTTVEVEVPISTQPGGAS